MNGVRVKHLVWEDCRENPGVLFTATTAVGRYEVDLSEMPREAWAGLRWCAGEPVLWGSSPLRDAEAAKAAAQADYETRIRAALEPQAPLTIASEGPERLWLDVTFRELFLPGEEQYGIEGLVEYRRAALEPQDAPAMAGVEIPAGYTPGPWPIHCHGDPWRIGGTDSDPIAWLYPSNDAQIFDGCPDDHEMEANARLIASAPAMAEELVALRAENARLREALREARHWHDSRRDDLRKQPPGPDVNWRRMEHREEIERLDAALAEGKS